MAGKKNNPGCRNDNDCCGECEGVLLCTNPSCDNPGASVPCCAVVELSGVSGSGYEHSCDCDAINRDWFMSYQNNTDRWEGGGTIDGIGTYLDDVSVILSSNGTFDPRKERVGLQWDMRMNGSVLTLTGGYRSYQPSPVFFRIASYSVDLGSPLDCGELVGSQVVLTKTLGRFCEWPSSVTVAFRDNLDCGLDGTVTHNAETVDYVCHQVFHLSFGNVLDGACDKCVSFFSDPDNPIVMVGFFGGYGAAIDVCDSSHCILRNISNITLTLIGFGFGTTWILAIRDGEGNILAEWRQTGDCFTLFSPVWTPTVPWTDSACILSGVTITQSLPTPVYRQDYDRYPEWQCLFCNCENITQARITNVDSAFIDMIGTCCFHEEAVGGEITLLPTGNFRFNVFDQDFIGDFQSLEVCRFAFTCVSGESILLDLGYNLTHDYTVVYIYHQHTQHRLIPAGLTHKPWEGLVPGDHFHIAIDCENIRGTTFQIPFCRGQNSNDNSCRLNGSSNFAFACDPSKAPALEVVFD